LNNIDISRLDLGLHKKMCNPVYDTDDTAKKSDFRLIDNRLVPSPYFARTNFDTNPFDREEASAPMNDSTPVSVKPPVTHRR
jgi:hypothetical protein